MQYDMEVKKVETQKVYVDVVAEFTKDGILLPRQITWEDGRKYEITRIKIRGIRYSNLTLLCHLHLSCLFLDETIFAHYVQNIRNRHELYRIDACHANIID